VARGVSTLPNGPRSGTLSARAYSGIALADWGETGGAMNKMRETVCWLLLALLPAGAAAQEETDPLFGGEETDEEAEPASGRFYGDFQARYDRIGSLNPLSGITRIERGRARLRFGWRDTRGNLEYAIAAKLARGTDSNQDTRANLDNEESDAEELDEAMLRWTFDQGTELLLGKTALPLDLTPMLWDSDLRPAGISAARSFAVGDFDRFSLVGGAFVPMHLYGDDSRLAALQAGYHWREGAPFSASVKLAYLDFSHLGDLVHEGLTRSNWREIIRPPGSPPPVSCGVCHGVAGDLVNEFRMVDLQGELRWTLDDEPLVVNVDVVHNLEASRDDLGGRVSVSYGDWRKPRGLQYGLAYQRFQRDAVLAAFSDDDWWFHSNARGVLAHVGYGIDPTWSVHLSYVRDRRDGPFRGGPVERWLFDVRAHW
jgi:hypothetical protein